MKNDFQLRLLLPKEWIEELDTIAREHFQTRLALIRQYLRAKLDEDLAQLGQIIAKREQLTRVKYKADDWLLKELKRKADDQW